MTTDHPLGDINGTQQQTAGTLAEPSILDKVLDLDEFLASDVRLAEKTARFCIDPALEAAMEDLQAELDTLTDSQGRPLAADDAPLAGGGRSAVLVASEIRALQHQYADAMRSVRMRQVDEDDWTAFQALHKQTLTDGPPYPVEFYEDLIVKSAIAPKFTVEKVRSFRKKVGHPAFNELASVAWAVNTQSGVSVPKSSLSSLVLKQAQRG